VKYLLLVYSPENAWTDREREQCLADSTQICVELESKGQFINASPLHPVATATSVKIREGKRLIIDGPFAETHEQLGGFFLIDVENLDEAMEVAARLPAGERGTVEIRPLYEIPGIPVPRMPSP